jgi:hypothetical protein
MHLRAPVLSLFAAGILLAPGELAAQGQNPSLAGHTFVPNTMVEGPFVATHFRSLVGAANAYGYQVGTVTIEDDTLVALEGNMTWVRVEFEQRQKVADWLALEGAFRAGARVGTNTASALADGVSVITGFKIGGIARVVQSDRVFASATLDLRRTGLTFLNIISFVEEIVDSAATGGPLDSISLSSKSGAWQARGGFRIAYAPGRAVGRMRHGMLISVPRWTSTSAPSGRHRWASWASIASALSVAPRRHPGARVTWRAWGSRTSGPRISRWAPRYSGITCRWRTATG